VQHAVFDPRLDFRAPGLGVLDDVRERFGDDEVGAGLDLGGGVARRLRAFLVDSGRMAERLDYWLAQPVT
jgi:hypothetical protein